MIEAMEMETVELVIQNRSSLDRVKESLAENRPDKAESWLDTAVGMRRISSYSTYLTAKNGLVSRIFSSFIACAIEASSTNMNLAIYNLDRAVRFADKYNFEIRVSAQVSKKIQVMLNADTKDNLAGNEAFTAHHKNLKLRTIFGLAKRFGLTQSLSVGQQGQLAAAMKDSLDTAGNALASKPRIFGLVTSL